MRNELEGKFLKISSRLYVDTCIVNPLSDKAASVITYTLTLWFYVFSWVGRLNLAQHQKEKKTIAQYQIFQNVTNTNWWPENETSSCSLFTASGPLLQNC